MKISELWLREWVNYQLTAQQLAAQLTMAGLEVDAVSPVAGQFDKVVVAEVLSTMPHPQADKLTVCEVNAGDEKTYTIVCGAPNVRAGLKVALACLGAYLPGGVKIKEVKLRGQLSQGMLCSGSELGLEERSDGILELAQEAPIGADLREYLSLDDHVLDIDLTPNRADCFSVLGVAREVAALNKLPMDKPHPKINKPQIDASLTIHLQATDACPQYCSRIIRAINPHAVTPLWMQERLRRGGVRPLHPVVDVTNYVMLELGQPMHAFDLQAIEGDIYVRYAHEEEMLILLDGQEVALSKDVLVIADSSKPLALAGIMGGEASSVQTNTTDILLESAFFNPIHIAGVARRYGLTSDSSQRFERGVDPALQVLAMERATELLHTIVGGEIGPITTVNHPQKLPQLVKVLFNPVKVKQLSGLEVPVTEMEQILSRLGMNITHQQDYWLVDIPSYRFDISLEVDLVEEIIRLYGYENITVQPMLTSLQAGKVNPYEQLSTRISNFLSHRGYHETISYSFVDPELQQAVYPQSQALQLLNPISQELSNMRVGMWPGLIASMIYNYHRQQTAIKLFEVGVVFNRNGHLVEERPCVAGLLLGEHGTLNWSETTRIFDFYDLKGDVQALFATLNVNDVDFVAAVHPALHPGKSACILVGKQAVGWIGALHPRLVDALDFDGEVLLFELSLSFLRQDPVHYRPISKYPQIRRDLSLLVNQEINAIQIEEAIRAVVAPEWLKGFNVFDVYTGDSIPAGKKSLAVALTLQDDNRTLVDAEINIIISAIIKKLKNEFAITLRD
ncbi:phenylalanine--tRNA ligase subunit beta [Legionella nagasakiensis]|uniref:phenylalanine--tRNA ligase subunit beta n=1 Tax=Legionella nagasakiensis TaxID=535290 RepID=UPI0010553872|nr:phenylalanine--tRNA ligase subunit beta [Legionella nagasakiensis]